MTQEQKIIRLAEQGWLPKGIAHILGMNEQVVRRKLKQLDVTPGFMLREKDDLPYGMTNESYGMRVALGQILTDLLQKYQQEGVSSLTGLNRGELTRAKERPYNHDWTLSQMERTLNCGDKTLKEIV